MKPVSPAELRHGRTYFAVFFANDRRDQPIVETFVFIGTDSRPEDDQPSTTQYSFQLARSYYQHGDWNQMTMDDRDQYVEPPVVSFDAKSIGAVHDADGLIEVLRTVR